MEIHSGSASGGGNCCKEGWGQINIKVPGCMLCNFIYNNI